MEENQIILKKYFFELTAQVQMDRNIKSKSIFLNSLVK